MILSLHARVNADPAKALQYTRQLAEKFPRDERTRLTLGLAYFGQQEYEKAAAEFKQAIQIDASYSPAYNMLGYSYRPWKASRGRSGVQGLHPSDPKRSELLGLVRRHRRQSHVQARVRRVHRHFAEALRLGARRRGPTYRTFTQAVTHVDAGKTESALRRLEAEYALDAGIGDTAA